ncbi:dethiobiotin synthase [Planococcus lenghuensis]|uniref:ATP-dependent dethiobiotin synthetase BioD n=1 Tax=Planococcus lenghuensis TaxID=2213202 RepID=A0A1Q2L120_9BACL|nr:dethiobiotin synthase [Planococcus lenghuensis]AQQ54113.1 dethiobiotin synthase [Planococcus lenghuensis]
MSGIFITGTSSNVGKTVITTCLTYAFQRRQVNAVPYKPVQCGAITDGAEWLAPDVELYRKVYTSKDNEQLNSFLYEPRFSPHLAARLANNPIDPQVIKRNYHALQETHDLVLVEGAGGLAVPLIDEQYGTPELIIELDIPIIIVTHATVGTLNATTLTAHYAQSKGLNIKGIIINGYPDNPTEGIKHNPAMIEKVTGIPVIGIVPQVENVEARIGEEEVLEELIRGIDLDKLYG